MCPCSQRLCGYCVPKEKKLRWHQGWELAHSLIRSFAQIAQIKWVTVSHLLRLLRTNEWLYVNRSGRSCQKSDSVRLLMINERISKLFVFTEQIANSLFCLQKNKRFAPNFLTKIIFLVHFFCTSNSLIPAFLMSDVSESLSSLTKNEQMSELLVFFSKLLIRSFFCKKRAIRSENWWANSQPWVTPCQRSLWLYPNIVSALSTTMRSSTCIIVFKYLPKMGVCVVFD